MNRELSFDFKKLRTIACCYIAFPVLVYCIGFLRWYYALLSVVAWAFGFYKTVTTNNTEQAYQEPIVVSMYEIALIFIFVLIWTYLGGLNGFFYQSSDWDCRNAIYYDLIKFDWPVVYESTGAALVYYIGHWLPPALVGKFILLTTGSIDWAWLIGKMALWVWTSLGLLVIVLLMFKFLRVNNPKKRFWAIVIFAGFSGLDVVGALYKDTIGLMLSEGYIHLEWWNHTYQFSSITTCVYWVFNQVIIPWIITLLFLMESNPKNYVFYCVACLLCGPFPCIGLVICMIVKAVYYCVRPNNKERLKYRIRNIFSANNIVSFLFVFPLIAMYILTNNAISNSGGSIGGLATNAHASGIWNIDVVIFLLLEVGIYIAPLFPVQKRNPIFYCLILTFITAPFLHVGSQRDYCMRATVPAIFILMLYVNDYLLNYFSIKAIINKAPILRKRVYASVIACSLIIGMATPAVELYRGMYFVKKYGTIMLEDLSVGSFDNGLVNNNFSCSEPQNEFFFKYISKEINK